MKPENILYCYLGLIALVMLVHTRFNDGTLSHKISSFILGLLLNVFALGIYFSVLIIPFLVYDDMSMDLGILILKDGFIRFILVVINIIAIYFIGKYFIDKYKRKFKNPESQ